MIKVLDSFVADKIAAGEVIERPVSAIKELVENSIDAGASSIIVEIRGGGKNYIRVTDDGCGIPSEEAEIAFLRHATSKISTVTDLDNITSLGFRGEALASISAVSRLTMVTKTADSVMGVKLVLHGGQLVSNERVGANVGTTIIAEDLFYNTPARRKFMKSDAREASSIIELMQQFAVFYSDMRFMMISNGQTVFTTSGNGDVLETVTSLYPEFKSSKLIPVEGEGVHGFVSDPGSTRTNRKGQLFFVNGRIVSSVIIEKGLMDGYNGRIFSGHPSAILFIDQSPSDIDVNIHPGKREIKFLRQNDVMRGISDAVSQAVSTEAGVPRSIMSRDEPVVTKTTEEPVAKSEQTSIRDFLSSLGSDTANSTAESAFDHAHGSTENSTGKSSIYDAEAGASSTIPKTLNINSESDKREPVYDIKTEAEAMPSVAEENTTDSYVSRPFDFDELTLKGYVFDTYIIMQSKDSLYIFDQHAAHERVFYERFMQGHKNSSHLPQPVLTPFTLNVSADVYFADRGWLEDMKSFGYDIEDFGDRTFMVRGIPAYMSVEEAERFARAYLDAIGEESGYNKTVVDKLIMRSCKSAVKAHDKLSEMEIKDLMDKLSKCENPYSCPHGRPTFIKMTTYDIERSFRRK